MDLKMMRKGMQTKLRCERSRRELRSAQTREPILRPYQNFDEIHKILTQKGEDLRPIKQEIVRALVAEHRLAPQGIWSQFLIVAFYPMLKRISKMLSSIEPDEMAQLLISVFLDVLSSLNLQEESICAYIKGGVLLHLRRWGRSARDAQDTFQSTDPEVLLNQTDSTVREDIFVSPQKVRAAARRFRLKSDEQAEATELLIQFVGQRVKREDLEFVVMTHIRGESLRRYVEETHPDRSTKEHARFYECVKKRRRRALESVRSILLEAKVRGYLDSRPELAQWVERLEPSSSKVNVEAGDRTSIPERDREGRTLSVCDKRPVILYDLISFSDLARPAWWGALPSTLGMITSSGTRYFQCMIREVSASWIELRFELFYIRRHSVSFLRGSKFGTETRFVNMSTEFDQVMRAHHWTGPPYISG